MAGRHSKYFQDPYHVTSRALSEQGKANFDNINWNDGSKPGSEPKVEPSPKPRIVAPGEVHRIDIPFANFQTMQETIRDIIKKGIKEEKESEK